MTSSALSDSIEAAQVDWGAAQLVTFEVRQSLRYQYPGAIHDVHQVLTLIPPDIVDGQRLLSWSVEVQPPARLVYGDDRFGNRLCRVSLSVVDGPLEFEVAFRLNRWPMSGRSWGGEREDRVFRLPSPLTEPGPAIAAAARTLRSAGQSSMELAETVNHWVYNQLAYKPGATGVGTTAEAALELGAGVCQDYAHLMIALCRFYGLPARYVSGHLLGEGSMHAWVEVLLPDCSSLARGSVWEAFDPTHGERTGLRHLLVAAGRDYGDVSPTRGTFRAPFAGRLAYSSKKASVVAVA